MGPKIWAELKTVIALWREESSVRKPNVDSGPSWWKKMERTFWCPCDGLDPRHWAPCNGLDPCHRAPCDRWRGKCKDLAIRGVYIILRASGQSDCFFLSCEEKNGSQEAGLITKAEGRSFRR